MKILGIAGSPRAKGNTAFSVRYALDVFKNEGHITKYLSLAKKEIGPCISCWKCEKE